MSVGRIRADTLFKARDINHKHNCKKLHLAGNLFVFNYK